MLVHLDTGPVNSLERCSAALELPAGLGGDRTSSIVGECYRIAVFDDRLPSETGHLAQYCNDPVRSFIRGAAQIRAAKDELLVFGADPPCRGRLASGFEVFDELPLVGD